MSFVLKSFLIKPLIHLILAYLSKEIVFKCGCNEDISPSHQFQKKLIRTIDHNCAFISPIPLNQCKNRWKFEWLTTETNMDLYFYVGFTSVRETLGADADPLKCSWILTSSVRNKGIGNMGKTDALQVSFICAKKPPFGVSRSLIEIQVNLKTKSVFIRNENMMWIHLFTIDSLSVIYPYIGISNHAHNHPATVVALRLTTEDKDSELD